MPVVPCQQCGTEFYVRPARYNAGKGKYCSRKCAGEAKLKNDTVSCPWCGKQFVKRAGQIYCSRSCGASANHAAHNRHGTEQNRCIVCEKKFTHGVSKHICSNACLVKHREGISNSGYTLFDDPWATGAIPPDKYAHELYRQPDPVLGF
ncbi:hypothetical protein [Halodesulfovibrio aestuarii]|uniref:Uncharacterized protein n=1 Tax=Halodesulfovibrio aestuarii TaxID=126333 RepID=A0ABV4JMV3_9BACT